MRLKENGYQINILIIFAIMLSGCTTSINIPEKAIPLYPDTVPNNKPTPVEYKEKDDNGWVTKVSIPTITPCFPEKGVANGTAIIIFPGGGYMGVGMNGGFSMAQVFNKIGITAFVVKYRLPSDEIMVDKSIGALQDAQQAVLTVRKHATEWQIKTNKIGVLGLSAGGHMATTEGTRFDKAVIDNKDNISLRPDFMVLISPVITCDSALTNMTTRDNLLGKTPSTTQIEWYSNEKHVTSNTPPTLLVQAADDEIVPVQNSLMFFNALLSSKVKAEMHIVQAGGHDFTSKNPNNQWVDWCKTWLEETGFL